MENGDAILSRAVGLLERNDESFNGILPARVTTPARRGIVALFVRRLSAGNTALFSLAKGL